MVVAGIIFFYRALTRAFPVVDLKAFKDTNFAVGSIFSFIMGIGLYGLTYLFPLYLGRIRGYDALMIGETMFVSGLAMFMTAPVAGALSAKFDPRAMMAIGFAGFALGTWKMSHLTADWDFYELLVPQILRGCSLMLCMVPINNLALGTLPPDRIRNASGLFNLTRNLGGAVGLAVINTELTSRSREHFARLAEQVDFGNREAIGWLKSVGANYKSYGLDGTQIALQKLSGMVMQQAWILSFIDIFTGLTVLFGSLVLLVAFMKKPKAAPPPGSGH